ncbi:MAG: pilus assembly protein PilM [Desulfurobacteriaceae bacterium]
MKWIENFLWGGERLLPGIDIGTYSIKLVQLEKQKENYSLKVKGEIIYEDQVFAGSEIVDAFTLASYVKEILKMNLIEEKEVAIHIPLVSCFYSVISSPPTQPPEEAVMNYMQSIISPEELAQVKVDYRVLPVSIDNNNLDIAVAAIKREYLEERIGIVVQAGLKPVVVDIEPATISNQFYFNYPDETGSPVCIVDIGATFTKIVVSFGGYPYITRNVEYGGNSITEHLQKEFLLGVEEAESLKKGETVNDITYEEAFDKVIREAIKKIVTEVLWTIDNFKDRFNMDVNKIYLYGGSSKLEGIVEVFKDVSKKEVFKGKPFKFKNESKSEEFGIAVGLSLRYKGDSDVKV